MFKLLIGFIVGYLFGVAMIGIVASAVRMTDKLNRFKTLIDKPQSQVDESLCDTLLDLANYAVMTARYIKEAPQ